MEAFTELDGLVTPLDRSNVDTDAVIPKQFLSPSNARALVPICFLTSANT